MTAASYTLPTLRPEPAAPENTAYLVAPGARSSLAR